MTKFDPHPPLFNPVWEKNFDSPTSSLDPTYKKSRPPTSILTIRSLAVTKTVRLCLTALSENMLRNIINRLGNRYHLLRIGFETGRQRVSVTLTLQL